MIFQNINHNSSAKPTASNSTQPLPGTGIKEPVSRDFQLSIPQINTLKFFRILFLICRDIRL
jgi:hypothetical protein